MNKSLISELLDGAAFPVIMLAVAVSQVKVGPNRKDTLRHGGQVAAGLQMGDRVQFLASLTPQSEALDGRKRETPRRRTAS